ncbi:hypothetical protein [Dactylosporangium sp. CA-139066]|uniref:hypothetical protein n=1 Tax=Dactylosporangium sp. CA-139066 TaxID=3239930 RepID=UPI003D8DE9D7
MTIANIEAEIGVHLAAIADLRGRGARALADYGASGREIMTWLRVRGLSDAEASTLCVDIIRERRAAAGLTS